MKPLEGKNPFKVGDILHHQFRYSASFPEFYEVLEATPKSVILVRLRNKMVVNGDGYGQIGEMMPDRTERMGEERRCKVGIYNDMVGVLVNSQYGYVATLWDGSPKEFYGD